MEFDSGFEDSFSDDDAEFIALTAKPRNEDYEDLQDNASGIVKRASDHPIANVQASSRSHSVSLETQQDPSGSRGGGVGDRTASTLGNDSIQSILPAIANSKTKEDLVQINNKYLAAVGEIAVLRGKIKDIEQNKTLQLRNYIKNHNVYSKEKETKINSLESQVRKLEEEKHFYIAELRNSHLPGLSNNLNHKKRKTNAHEDPFLRTANTSLASVKSNQEGAPRVVSHVNKVLTDGDVEMSDITTADASVLKRVSSSTDSIGKSTSRANLRTPNYKSLFLESIWNHCMMGSKRKTIDLLSQICIPFDYGYKSFQIRKFHQSVSSPIIGYLININDNLRIDDLISEFLDILISFTNFLVEREEILATPMLLALIHNSLIFRTNSVTKEGLKSVLEFAVLVADKFFVLLDSPSIALSNSNAKSFSSQAEEFLETKVAENNQTIILQSFNLVFILDILEALCKIAASFDDNEFVKEIWTSIIPLDLIRFCLSSSCPINCIVNMVESLLASVTDGFAVNLSPKKSYDFQKTFCDKELIKLITSLLFNGVEPKPHGFIYGLNRAIGNNSRMELLEEIIPHDAPFLTRSDNNLLDAPFPLSQESERTLRKVDFAEKQNHEEHLFYLKLSTIKLLETYMTVNQIEEVTYIKSPESVKVLVEEMRRQQELIMRNPRSKSVHLRIRIISSVITLLAPLLLDDIMEDGDLTQNLISRISTGTKRQMIVVLTRIAFSSTLAAESAAELLNEARAKLKYDGFLFNEFCERQARELNNIRNINDQNKTHALLAESSFANGVEYGFSDDIIGLSRDILEVCITPDEADNLYYAFIAEDADDI